MNRAAWLVVGALSVAVVACGDDPAAATSTTKDLTSASAKSGSTTTSGSGSSTSTTSTTDSTPIAVSSLPQDGRATFYSATGGGSCSYDPTPNDLDVAAMDVPEFNGSAVCGTCLQVKGPKATVTVRVTDRCPGCAAKGVNLDLSAQAFAKIADPVQGNIPITYAEVPCGVTGPIEYHFKDGSSKFWTAIQIRNHKVPVAKVEYEKSGTWTNIDRLDYNYFVVAKGVGDQPDGLHVRVTSTDDQVLEDTLAGTITANTTVNGKAQFE